MSDHSENENKDHNFYVLLTVHLSITLGMTTLTHNCFIF